MKLNKQDVLLIIVILLVGYMIFTTQGIRTDIKSYKSNIELIQTKIDSANIIDKTITTKIDSVNSKVITITKEVNNIDRNISILKEKTNEKVNTIDTYTASDIEQFFTDRYN
jgi:septal ring factor EnvC (AmiA/AmiB activator)